MLLTENFPDRYCTQKCNSGSRNHLARLLGAGEAQRLGDWDREEGCGHWHLSEEEKA